MKKNPARSKGFTLIELLIVMTITPILALVIAMAMIEYPRLYATIEADQEMAQEIRNAWQWMGRDIRQAEKILPQAGPFQTASANTLVLSRPAGEKTRVVVWTIEAGALTRLEFSDPEAKVLADKITLARPETSFSLDLDQPAPDASRVRVRLESRRPILAQERKFSLSGEFRLRRATR
jgi:prepilin-type N-terminal cleavage/methylation domain-containing protein